MQVGPGQKATDDERRVASMAAIEARTKRSAMPVGLEERWRDSMPSPEQMDADIRKLATVISLHGVDVLNDSDRFARLVRTLCLNDKCRFCGAYLAPQKDDEDSDEK